VGHIYLIQITDGIDTQFIRVAKLTVDDITQNSVTIRWDVLQDSEPYGTCYQPENAPPSGNGGNNGNNYNGNIT
jgi:hypothetical protein